MPFSFPVLTATVLSWTFASSGVGVLVLAASSLGEHFDAVLWMAGFLLILLGFWVRDWKARMEAAQKVTADKVGEHDIAIATIKEDGRHITRELQALASDTRRFHRWAYEAFPPDNRQDERERRRLQASAPPPMEDDKESLT